MNNHIPLGYKDSPLGIIPKEWEVKRLGDVAEVKGGYAFDSKKMSDTVQQYQIVKMGNLYGGTLDLSRCRSYWGTLNEIEKDYLLKEGDIIITLTGTIGKRDYGNSVQIKKEKNLLLNQRNAKIVSKTIDNCFLFFVVNSERFLHQFFYSSRGGTGSQTNVGIPDIEDIRIIVPSIKEQKGISDIMNLWDTAIEKQSELIEKLKLRKRALMQQLLTGKKRLPGFSGEWRKVKLGDICTMERGELLTSGNYVVGNIPVIAGGKEPAGYHNCANRLCNTITVSCSGASAGYVAFYEQPIFATDCFTISESDKYNVKYIYYLLLGRQERIYQLQTGGAQPHVHPKDIAPMIVNIPSIEEQNPIATVLVNADKEIELAEDKLANLQSQKRGLMQQLLTGKKRLL